MAAMSAHADSNADATDDVPKRVKPHQIAIALGIGVGLFTLVSGILPQITSGRTTTKCTAWCSSTSRARCNSRSTR